MAKYNWKTCENCEKRMRQARRYKGKILCYKCYRKKAKRVGGYRPNFSLEEALKRTYKIRGYLNKKQNSICAACSFPSILTGHKVKLVLIK